jgi:hypothetical protein
MLLDNPERSRRLAEVVAAAPANGEITQRLVNLLARQTKSDADLIDALRRVLESAAPQARRLRQLIKEIVNG